MKALPVALLISSIILVGCAGPSQLLFANPIVVDHLDGNYQRLASCTYEHLARLQGQLSITDLHGQPTVRIPLTKAPETHWQLSSFHQDTRSHTHPALTSPNP